MARRCDRPGCSEPGTVAYGFDAVRRFVWLDAGSDDDRAKAGALCIRHADRLTAPRGWWLDDRRIDVPELFHERAPAGAAGPAAAAVAGAGQGAPVEGEAAAAAPKRRRRRKTTDGRAATEPVDAATAVALAEPPLPADLVPFSFDADEPAVVAEGIVVVEEVVVLEDDGDVVGGAVVRGGAVVVEDDASPLNPLLEPSTPLLARAFTGAARTDRPHHRARRAGSGGEAADPQH